MISLLQQGEDPWKVEKESPGSFSTGEWVGTLQAEGGEGAGVRLGGVGRDVSAGPQEVVE